MNRKLRRFFALVLLVALAPALSNCAAFNSLLLSTRCQRADALYEQGQYGSAVLEYSLLYQEHPSTDKAEYCLLQKGRCLYLMRAWGDARRVFEDYLRQFPDGHHASEARAYQMKSAANEYRAIPPLRPREDVRGGAISVLEKRRDADPCNVRLRHNLADAYWRQGRYEQAIREYLTATEIEAARREYLVVDQRPRASASSTRARPSWPSRPSRADSLALVDVRDFHLTECSDDTQVRPDAARRFVVVGKVINHSPQSQKNVEVEVSVFNIDRQILSAARYRIGEMAPGEARAFATGGDTGGDFSVGAVYECRIL